MKFVWVLCLLFLHTYANSQGFGLEMLSSSQATNIRGLSPIDDKVVWVCGNNGHVGLTKDGGQSWEWSNPKGYEKTDFRDIEAFDDKNAVVMASGTPAIILVTGDGGKSWKEVFKSNDTTIFLDALDFWNAKEGVCLGDFVAGRPYMLQTKDGGQSWQPMDFSGEEAKKDTLASFAASGTCLRVGMDFDGDSRMVVMAVGGGQNALAGFILESPTFNKVSQFDLLDVPYNTIAKSQGLFSLAIDTVNSFIWIAGGNYANEVSGFSTVYDFEGEEFIQPAVQVWGYRSCIELFTDGGKQMVIACGLNGADVCEASEKYSWKNFTSVPLNVARKAKNSDAVFLAGPRGTIFKLVKKK